MQLHSEQKNKENSYINAKPKINYFKLNWNRIWAHKAYHTAYYLKYTHYVVSTLFWKFNVQVIQNKNILNKFNVNFNDVCDKSWLITEKCD